MLDPRDSRLWQTATQLGLVDPERLEACWEAIPPEKRTRDAIDRRLARQAVHAGLLTLWQAQQILAGRQNGLRIGRYVLLDQIGHGGMGRVYLARDTRLGRQVAIKVLSRERSQSARALARFRREARVGAQLQHENLIRVYDEGEYGGMPYLVMEYIEGRSVAQLIAEHGPLNYRTAADLARQVALGLEHLHQKGLLHRDVNPANILVNRDGTAKLTDLGLAIDLGDTEDVVTRDGATVGTFDYISPEQARNPRQIDSRSDIYSLGCTLYQMIAGRVPFPAQSLPEKLFAHQTAQPEPLTSVAPGTPEGLDAVVRKMMAKSPDQRYARPLDAARALEPFAVGAHVAPSSVAPASRSLWESVAPGGAADPGGSRLGPELDPAAAGAGTALATPPGSATPTGSGTNDPLEFFRIDLGDEPLSSGSALGSPRSRTTDRPGIAPRLRWPPILVAAGLALGVIAAMSRGCESNQPKPSGTERREAAAQTRPVERPRAPISVVYRDGERVPVETLTEAILRAANRPAEVVLGNEEPLELEISRSLPVNGRVLVRADEGTRPAIRLRFGAAVPFFVVDPRSSIEIEGIDLIVDLRPGDPAPRAVFEIGGRIRLNRCALVTTASTPALAAVSFSGATASLRGCWIEGFRPAVHATLFPGANLHVEQSLVHAGLGNLDQAGWVLELAAGSSRLRGDRRVELDHVTALGLGLAGLDQVAAATPIRFDVSKCVVRSRTLLRWGGSEPFPDGIVWTGRGNLYDLSADHWVVLDTQAATSASNSPEDLDGWSRGPIAETESAAVPLRFAVDPPGAGRTPLDYSLPSIAPPQPGIEPSQVATPPLSWQ
ncbi:MAG: hypothetical protein KatS3mg108_2221 [Isosphaeraceae bacterium]|jgi:serine/threonine protein kinase|nr:MAG: hypothetical protein KatS3mg108_2221 [Isosphaeraceae bacterium]